jgi:hypothetical protein
VFDNLTILIAAVNALAQETMLWKRFEDKSLVNSFEVMSGIRYSKTVRSVIGFRLLLLGGFIGRY